MEELDIIEERNGYRVRLQQDTDAGKPENDGAAPTLQVVVEPYVGYKSEVFNPGANGFEEAFDRFVTAHGSRSQSNAVAIFERYLRIFHGTTKFQTWNMGRSREYGYIAFDTAAWRERVGCPVDALKDEDMLAEVRAWATGDVWGYIVEKELSFEKKYFDADGEDAGEETGTEWFEVKDSSCWGHYGRDWAEQAAKQALSEVTVYAGLGNGSDV